MISKSALATFIRKVANGEHTEEEWNEFAVTHLADSGMEAARREAVHEALGYGETSAETRKRQILSIASRLENESQ